MRRQLMGNYTILAALFLLALMLMVATPVARAEDRGCPVQAGEGVICQGPQEIVQGYLPLIQASAATSDTRQCPYPVGDGVICTGPDIPEAQPPAPSAALGAGPQQAPSLFLPLVGG